MTEIDFREQPQLIHGFAAAEILGRYGVRDKDIENAVRYHTTGRAGMSRLEKIVYLADKQVQGERRVTIEERFAAKREKFKDNPEALAGVERRYQLAKRAEALL